MFSTTQLSRLLSVLLCIALVGLVAFWASRLLAPRAAIAPVTVANAASAQTSSNWAGQLFGSTAVKPEVTAGPVADAQVQVLGIITGDRAAAVLVVDGKPAKPFTPGQTIASGVILKSVSVEGVTIDRRGVLAKLAGPNRPNVSVLTAGPAKNNLQQSGASATPAQPFIQNGSSAISPASGLPPAFVSPAPVVNPIDTNPSANAGASQQNQAIGQGQNQGFNPNGQSANNPNNPGSSMRGNSPPQ